MLPFEKDWEDLLPEDKKKVYDFIEFLKYKRSKEKTAPKKQFSFSWAGVLNI